MAQVGATSAELTRSHSKWYCKSLDVHIWLGEMIQRLHGYNLQHPYNAYNSYFTSLFWHVVIKYGLIKFYTLQVFSRFSRWKPGFASKHTFPVEARKKKIQIIMQLVPSRGSSASACVVSFMAWMELRGSWRRDTDEGTLRSHDVKDWFWNWLTRIV